MTLKWLLIVLALTGLAAAGLAGCTKAEQQREEAEQIAGDFAESPETDSSGWQAAEHDIAVDEGLVAPEELAALRDWLLIEEE